MIRDFQTLIKFIIQTDYRVQVQSVILEVETSLCTNLNSIAYRSKAVHCTLDSWIPKLKIEQKHLELAFVKV